MALPFILPQVQRHDWEGRDQNSVKAIHNQLEPGPGAQTIPLVSWAFSVGPMAAFVGPRWLEMNKLTAEEVHAQALANLSTRGAAVRVMEIPKPDGELVQLAVIEGDRGDNPDHIAAADHILNRSALAMLHKTVDSSEIVVAIPCRQVMYAADISLALEGPFVNLANTLPFEGAQQLTTVVFLVHDGQIVGKLNYE
jgi:uncharacterized protein YtpQ (UPF0354 family)